MRKTWQTASALDGKNISAAKTIVCDSPSREPSPTCASDHGSDPSPDPEHVSTSFAERQNLNVRMDVRRYTRLTNAFSRKIENHSAAVALYYFAYNFINIHRTLRTTPAMAAGVTDRLWEVSDLVAMLQADERGLERAA
jgi:hypothetical protein